MITRRDISLNDTAVQTKGNIPSDMDGEKVLLSVKNGKYYNLGEIGGIIWGLIKIPRTVNQLVETLLSEYEVEQMACEEQVLSFLGCLSKEGLIEIREERNS